MSTSTTSSSPPPSAPRCPAAAATKPCYTKSATHSGSTTRSTRPGERPQVADKSLEPVNPPRPGPPVYNIDRGCLFGAACYLRDNPEPVPVVMLEPEYIGFAQFFPSPEMRLASASAGLSLMRDSVSAGSAEGGGLRCRRPGNSRRRHGTSASTAPPRAGRVLARGTVAHRCHRSRRPARAELTEITTPDRNRRPTGSGSAN